MTSTDWGLLVSGLVPFLIALTAWLRAEVANRTSKATAATVANATAQPTSRLTPQWPPTPPTGDGK